MKPLLVILTAFAFSTSMLASAASKRPNVVMLLADDLGWKDIGCYGGPVKTPTLDKLAASGTRFTDFYSGAAVCSPSRAVLLTGRTNLRSGIYSWINDNDQRTHLPTSEVTLAELLQRNEYATAHFGKWHLGLPSQKFPDKPTPSDHGFDFWFATGNNAQPSHRNPRNFLRNGKPVGELQGYACHIVIDEAISWLDARTNTDQPFFLNVWIHEPHAPIAAPDQVVAAYGDTKDPGAIYSGTIDNTDQAIARLLKKLKEVDAPEDTIIIYSSDNGSYRAERVGHLRGTKGSNYEGGIRVPGIFSWPGHINAGAVTSEPAGLTDILPTVCGLTGIDPPPVHLDGADLSPLLLPVSDKALAVGRNDSTLTHEGPAASALPLTTATFERSQPLLWYLPLSGPAVAMRDGRYSMVAYRNGQLPKDRKGLAEIKRQITTLLKEKGILEAETRGSTLDRQLFEGFNDREAERLRGQFIRLNQFHESWIPGLKQTQLTRFELYDLEADPSQKTNIAIRKPVLHAKMKSQLLKLAASAIDDAFDWSSGQPAPTREPTNLAHRFSSDFRSPFDAFVYMNRIPIEPEALEDQAGLASRIESRLANQEGRVQIKLPPPMKRDAYEGFKLAAGIQLSSGKSCFVCHHLPALRSNRRDSEVPTLRNRTYTRDQFRTLLKSESHKNIPADDEIIDRLRAFVQSLNDVPTPKFRPLILNATVLDTTGDIE